MLVERNKDGKSTMFGYQQITAGLRPEFRINDKLSLGVTGGSTLVRSFSESERKIKSIFKEKKMADPRFASTFYVAVALRWNLP
jgi:hypothetical protein